MKSLDLKGNTWLFFGDQHFTTDFLYQTEWQAWLKEGYLEKMDVAFLEIQTKIYVQHRIMERSAQFNAWLEKEHLSIFVMKTHGKRCASSHQRCVSKRTGT